MVSFNAQTDANVQKLIMTELQIGSDESQHEERRMQPLLME
jgi:hypothetical protein